MLLGKGADPNARTHLGATPLHIAAATCNLDLLKLLLATPGVEAAARDAKGRTSEDVLCLEGGEEDVEREIREALREAEQSQVSEYSVYICRCKWQLSVPLHSLASACEIGAFAVVLHKVQEFWSTS